jgi:hypothetical protein
MPTEPQIQVHDIGEITRKLQDSFRIFKKETYDHEAVDALAQSGQNLVTPKNVGKLLDALQTLTDETQAARDKLSNWIPDAAILAWDNDMAQWRARLAMYKGIVAAAHATPEDRQAILWGVTAPLLLGFYGGHDSKLPLQPLDAVTPFSLANQLAVDAAWRTERERRFWEDVKKAALDVAAELWGLAELAVIAAAIVAVVWVIMQSRGRKRED